MRRRLVWQDWAFFAVMALLLVSFVVWAFAREGNLAKRCELKGGSVHKEGFGTLCLTTDGRIIR